VWSVGWNLFLDASLFNARALVDKLNVAWGRKIRAGVGFLLVVAHHILVRNELVVLVFGKQV
jgi:hypothetical protein